jgi:hypothetical protein
VYPKLLELLPDVVDVILASEIARRRFTAKAESLFLVEV